MKNKVLLFVLGVSLIGCSENETVYTVDQPLNTYVETFYSEAAERGVTLPKNLKAFLDESAQSTVMIEVTNDQNILRYNESTFLQHSEAQRSASIYRHLGALLLKRTWNDNYSYMNWQSMSYPLEDKEVLFDEMFN